MSTDETRGALAALLADHWEIEGTHAEGFACSCGYSLGDGTGDLDERHRAHFAEALLASGLIPEGTTAEEWGARQDKDGSVHTSEGGWRGRNAETYARQTAGDFGIPVRRTRTTYPDRITDWEEVQ